MEKNPINSIVGVMCDHRGEMGDCTHNPLYGQEKVGCIFKKDFLCTSEVAQVDALKRRLGTLTGKAWLISDKDYKQKAVSSRADKRTSNNHDRGAYNAKGKK